MLTTSSARIFFNFSDVLYIASASIAIEAAITQVHAFIISIELITAQLCLRWNL